MASSHNDFFKKRNDPNYLNWLAVGMAFRILCDGLRPYAKKEMQAFHSLMLTKLSGDVCTCSYTAGKKPNPHEHVKTSCRWAKNLGKYHHFKRKSDIPWYQSDSSKWHDSTEGYWEIAKLFMSDLGNNWRNVKDPSSTDPTGLLNLLFSCTYFKVEQTLVKSVRKCRNKWAHAPDQLLTAADKQSVFQEINKLINDVELKSCKEVQDCRGIIEDARTAKVSILDEDEIRIWKEVKYFQESKSNREVKKKQKQMEKRIRELDKVIAILDSQTSHQGGNQDKNSWFNNTALFTFLFGLLHSAIKGWSKSVWWIVMMLSLVRVGDKSVLSSDYGCPRCTKISPIKHFHFRRFNFSSHLPHMREKFYGRKWLFDELEVIFESDRLVAGVLVTGEPGSGKSALMAQLICSPYSSWFIHNNIIGYHLCDYSEKGKRHGGWFVRNLVDQVAGSIPEFADHVVSNEQLRRELDDGCKDDPIGCFHSTIIRPLRDLKTQPDSLQYIVIDALDECFEKDVKRSPILEIINKKILYFPKWLKVILTSRNLTVVTSRIPRTVKRVHLDPSNDQNMEDVRRYIRQFLSQNLSFIDRLEDAVRGRSTAERIGSLVDKLTNSGEGNFLVVKKTLEYMANCNGSLTSFPASLYDMYNAFFERHFGERDFQRFKPLFEVLLAAGSPLHIDKIHSILKQQNITTDVAKLTKEVSLFLRYGQDGTVKIYHLSLAEWLVSQASDADGFCVNKSIGHQYVADYLVHSFRKKSSNLTLAELSDLSMHLVYGGTIEKHLEALDYFNVSNVRDLQNGRCILHSLAMKAGSFPLLRIFLPTFAIADIPDNEGKTPAFFAASEGIVENLRAFIEAGANVNYYTSKNDSSRDPVSILLQNSGLENAGLMYTAIVKGHVEVVKLLLQNNISREQRWRNLPTPLQLAAAKGDVNMVKLLFYGGFKPDIIALHHAAAKNHSTVVSFLVETAGIVDKCVPSCRPAKVLTFSQNLTVEEFHSSLCESALHSAVSRRHMEIVKFLLGHGNDALECIHHSGKTPLMDAVERNDSEMVELLLNAGANVHAACGGEMSSDAKDLMCSISEKYSEGLLYTAYCERDYCPCGNKALHLCGRYGLWEMALELSRKWSAKLDKNCDGELPFFIAIRFDQREFIKHLIDDKTNFVHFFTWASYCSSVETLKLFASDLDILTSSRLPKNTLIEAFFSIVRWSPYPDSEACRSCSLVLKSDHRGALEMKVNSESRKRIAALELFITSQSNNSYLLKEKNDRGETALHVTSRFGFSDAVKYLVRRGSKINAKDAEGKTALQLALDESPKYPISFSRCFTIFSGEFSACNTTSYDETVSYLIWTQKSKIQICDSKSANLLKMAVYKQMPLSFYTLLKVGVDPTCRVNQPFRPLLLHLNVGGQYISEIFKIFETDVSVECGVPFRESELHLMAYSSRPSDTGNFFNYSKNQKHFPLKTVIKNHPDGHKLFDKCRDEEGYLAIHRAVQGGNVDAIEWFIHVGVSIFRTTISGLTVLDLSALYLEPSKSEVYVSSYEGVESPLTATTYTNRLRIFKILLEKHFLPDKEKHSLFQCSSDSEIKPWILPRCCNKGIFTAVKKTLEFIADSVGKVSLESFPASLYYVYKTFFKLYFSEQDFQRYKLLFEVLLAADTPLPIEHIRLVFKLQNLTTDIAKLIEEVPLLLRYEKNGTVKIYHSSFAEWLVRQTRDEDTFPINMTIGHQYVADYLVHSFRKRSSNLTLAELSELSMHLVLGGTIKKHLETLDYFNVSNVRDLQNGRCILHSLAMKAGSFPLLRIFLPTFAIADIPDNEGKTPAFFAASEGIVENLRAFIEAGANVNYYIDKNDSSRDPVSILLQNSGLENAGLMYTAIVKGHVEVVKLLLQNNISREQRWRNLPRPLQLAAAKGDVNMVKLLFYGGFKPDIIALHHAAAKNHSTVVSFLVKTAGVVDTCVPSCKPAKVLTFSQNLTVEEFHSSLCESALHSAVSRRHMEIVKFLLGHGNDALECIHHSGKTPLMDAVERNDSEMVELLLNAGANVHAACGDEMSSDAKDLMCSISEKYSEGLLYSAYCERDYCPCGNKALHLCGRYGLWEMALELLRKRNAKLDENCDGELPFDIAIRFDQREFIKHLIHDKTISGHFFAFASHCSSVETLKLFASDLDILTSSRLPKNTLIEAFFSIVHWSPYPDSEACRSCSLVLKSDHRGALEMKVNSESRKRIAALELFIHSQSNISYFLNEKSDRGETALHVASRFGFSDAVKYFVRLGSKINAKNTEGKTALQLALDGSPKHPISFSRCFTIFSGEFSACNTTSFDETVSYLIWLQKSEIRKCGSESAATLISVLREKMPLSLYALLKVGVVANCQEKQSFRPLLRHLNIGGEQISEIFLMYKPDVSIECGVGFRKSELHLMAYSSRISDIGNFFKSSENRKQFPLTTAIKNHPDGPKILDKCRDDEGYLAIHRAVQGGNIDAIKWFIDIGVDIFETTASGITALELSALFLEPSKAEIFESPYEGVELPLTATTYKNRRRIFELLLEKHFLSAEEKGFQCSSDCQGLFLSHITPSKGGKISKLFRKKCCKIPPNSPPDCENIPRVLPRCCGKGSFVTLKKTLQFIADSIGNVSLKSFPAGLYDLYKIFSKLYFGELDFRRFKPLFEVLLAAGTPLPIENIRFIFKLQNLTTDVTKLIEKVSLLLRYEENGAVRIYHFSFAEWLVKQTRDEEAFPINMTIGHQYLADFLFLSIRQRNGDLTLSELSELSKHLVSGGIINKHLQTLDCFNVSEIWDLQSGRCILHNLAMKAGSLPILRIFLSKFTTPDIPDNEGKTPAFYAASEGIVENLRVLIEAGANVNYYTGNNHSSADPVSVLVQNCGLGDQSGLIYTAIVNGHSEVVKLLLLNNISRGHGLRNLPALLRLASAKGDLNIVKLLYYSGFKPDIISLHHAAAKNHYAVVSFLVETAGVVDKCLPSCKPAKAFNLKKKLTVEEFHSSLCESALYSAVSRGHTDIVKYLLTHGNDSLECKHHSGKTPLMDAVERNDFEMVKLLLNAGANVEATCGYEMCSDSKELLCTTSKKYKDEFLYTVYCEKDFCPCGYKSIHLCARYGLWEMGELLLRKWNARVFDSNCDGESAPIIAINFDQPLFMERLVEESSLYAWYIRKIAVLKAAACGSLEILKLLVNVFKVFTTGTSLWNIDMIRILHSIVFWSPHPSSLAFRSCSQVLKSDHHGTLQTKVDIESKNRIASLKLIIQAQNDIPFQLNRKNDLGLTALHVAAYLGFSDAVKSLVQFGSSIYAKDAEGRTALQTALNVSDLFPPAVSQCFSIFNGEFSACNTTSYDETVSFLIWEQQSRIQKCDSESAKMLMSVIRKQLPLSFYSLLKAGVDLTCSEQQLSLRPLLLHLNLGGEQISEVFKMFQADILVRCGVPFRLSELHLMAYSSRISTMGNFFKSSKNQKPFPFQRLVKNHADGHKTFDKCRDGEGYLAIHRAVQGGNIDAIRWFIGIGVDLFKKTTSGLTALDLAALYLEPIKSELRLSMNKTYKRRRHIFQILLKKYFLLAKEKHFFFQCNSDYAGLSPLHISAVRGGKCLELFYNKARNIFSSLPLHCENKHWILPGYLAYFYDSVEHARKELSLSLVDVKKPKSFYLSQFPDREAEFYIIYDYFYETPNELMIPWYGEILNLYPVKVMKCPRFYELLPKKKMLDVMVTRYHPVRMDVENSDEYMLHCFCARIMQHLQEWFTSRPRRNRHVSWFIAERMGWSDVSLDGDVRDRWPFYFLYKKAMNDYKAYKYLDVLSNALEINDQYYYGKDDDIL